MAVSESNMAEFMMAAIIKLSQNEQVKFFCAKWLNPIWQSSKMDAEFKITANIKLTENEREKVFYANGGNQSWQLWMSLRRKTKMAESKLAKLNMAEFKMAAIFKLSLNEWVKVFIMQNGWIQNGRIQYRCHHQVESEWMSEIYFCAKWWNPRWLPSSSSVRMNDFESDWINWSQSFEENGWIQDGRIQDGRIQYSCHHQVQWEWMSLSQIELVWVRVRVERECFWVNLREDNKVSESQMAVGWILRWQNLRWLPSSSWVRMNEVKLSFVLSSGWIQWWQSVRIAAIIRVEN